MGLFFYTKIGSIRSIGDLPTTNIIEPVKSTFFIFVFGIPWYSFAKKDTTKESQTDPKTDRLFKKAIKKDTTFVDPRNNFPFPRKTWDSNPRTLLHAYRVSNTAS